MVAFEILLFTNMHERKTMILVYSTEWPKSDLSTTSVDMKQNWL